MSELAFFIIGAGCAMAFADGMLLFHRPTQRRWLRYLTSRLGASS